ncbi:phage integrase SAM-like domain-containing protein [Spirosoma pomorum]
MPSFTYNVELATKPDQTGRWPAMIRVHLKDQKPGRVTTSVKIANAPKHWQLNKWGKWIKAYPDADTINQNILNDYNRITERCKKWLSELSEGEMLTPAMLVNRFREGNVGDSYFALVDLVMEDVKEQAYSTYLSKLSVVNQFKEFASPSLVLPAVTPGYIHRFQDHLRKTKPRYGNKLKGSTINNYFAGCTISCRDDQINECLSLIEEEVGLKTP